MLVLTRKIRESIVIGDNIVVEILDVAPGKIRIGIAAPIEVRVVRGELIPHDKDTGSIGSTGSKTVSKMVAEKGERSISGSTGSVGRPFSRFKRPPHSRRGKQNMSKSNGRQCNASRNNHDPLDKLGHLEMLGQLGQREQIGKKGDFMQPSQSDASQSDASHSDVVAAVPRLSTMRTVADVARNRLRQLREQIAARKNSSEVAETKTDYLIDSDFIDLDISDSGFHRKGSEQRAAFLDDGSLDDDAMSFETYWRVEGLSHYPDRPSLGDQLVQGSFHQQAEFPNSFMGTGMSTGLGVVGSDLGVVGSGVGVVGSDLGVVGSDLGVVGTGLGVVGSGLGVGGSGLGSGLNSFGAMESCDLDRDVC